MCKNLVLKLLPPVSWVAHVTSSHGIVKVCLQGILGEGGGVHSTCDKTSENNLITTYKNPGRMAFLKERDTRPGTVLEIPRRLVTKDARTMR